MPVGTAAAAATGIALAKDRSQPPVEPALPETKPLVDLGSTVPLDERGPNAAWLDTLQGNILKAHGRDHGVHLLFSLPEDDGAARALVKTLSIGLTSARAQLAEAARYRKFRVPGGLFASLALSGSGYARIAQRHPDLYCYTAVDERGQRQVTDSLFGLGMRTVGPQLSDPPADALEAPYRGAPPIDVMLMLAHDDEHALLAAARQVIDAVEAAAGTMVAVEHGLVRRNANGDGIEHFGFVDGRSQPQFLASEFDATRTADSRGESIDQWDPFAALGGVLVRDPGMPGDERCHGSFLVFRKLEQNVKGFQEQLAGIAAALGEKGDAGIAHAGALVVGRYQDGTPLMQQEGPGGHPAQANNFTYAADVRGGRCPMHAHIRKVNPRGHSVRDDQTLADEKRHRITRRSMLYGERAEHETPDTLPTHGVGVLFMCYQAAIEDQFAFMQKDWCNTAWFPQSYVGVDPLAGQDDPREVALGHQAGGTNESHQHFWPERYGKDPAKKAPFAACVTTLGGEFFFVPSLPFLHGL